jgi:hypothetical protein
LNYLFVVYRCRRLSSSVVQTVVILLRRHLNLRAHWMAVICLCRQVRLNSLNAMERKERVPQLRTSTTRSTSHCLQSNIFILTRLRTLREMFVSLIFYCSLIIIKFRRAILESKQESLSVALQHIGSSASVHDTTSIHIDSKSSLSVPRAKRHFKDVVPRTSEPTPMMASGTVLFDDLNRFQVRYASCNV